MESIYEHAGGAPAIRRFVEVFYASVLADPVLTPLFGEGKPEHVPAWRPSTPSCTRCARFRSGPGRNRRRRR